MDDAWSLGTQCFGTIDRRKDRAVSLFLDLSSMWDEEKQTGSVKLGNVLDELCKLAGDFTTESVHFKHCIIRRNLLTSAEEAALEHYDFVTELVDEVDEVFELTTQAMLLWLLDTRNSNTAIAIITRNPKFGPLFTKLRRRNVFIVLISELSGCGIRPPIPVSLRKDASILYDFVEVCLLLERITLKSQAKDDTLRKSVPSSERRVYRPETKWEEEDNKDRVNGDERQGHEAFGYYSASNIQRLRVTDGGEDTRIETDGQCHRPQMVSADSEITLDGLEELNLDAQSLELRLSLIFSDGVKLSGTADAASLLSLPRSGGLTRSNTVNFAIERLEAHVKALESAWHKKDAPQVTRLLRRFARAGYNVQSYLRGLITQDSKSKSCKTSSKDNDLNSLPSTSQYEPDKTSSNDNGLNSSPSAAQDNSDKTMSDDDALNVFPSTVRDTSNNCEIGALTFGFVMECVRELYDHYTSVVAPLPSLNLHNVSESADTSKQCLMRGATTTATRRAADALDASHMLISSLEGCSVGELNEELHQTALDIVHSLLKAVPALIQAERLLRLVGVSANDISLVLQPYVEKWMKAPDQSASAQAFSFAYRSGLMESVREKQVSDIDGLIPSLLQQQGHLLRQQVVSNSHNSNSSGNIDRLYNDVAGKDDDAAGKDDDDGWFIGSTLETSNDNESRPPTPPNQENNIDSDGQQLEKTLVHMRDHYSKSSTDSLSGLMLKAIEPISPFYGGANKLNISGSVEERVFELLSRHKEGLLGSDVPRLYSDEYGERLVLPQNPSTNERYKLKDFLLSIEGVGTYIRNTQPVFVAIVPWGDEPSDDYGFPIQAEFAEIRKPTNFVFGEQQMSISYMHLNNPFTYSFNGDQQQQQRYISPLPTFHNLHEGPSMTKGDDRAVVQKRLLQLLREAPGILGAQLPSKYLETYGMTLSLEAADGSKTKLKEFLLSDDMTNILRLHVPPLKLVLQKAGHDRRYMALPDV